MSTSAPPAQELRLAELVRDYGSVRAVDQISLDVGAGEFITLLGPSGSGMTTTLLMVAGFTAPTAGRILLGERDITRVPPHGRNLGVVFQSYALFPHLDVYENLAFPLKIRQLDARADRAQSRNREIDTRVKSVQTDQF